MAHKHKKGSYFDLMIKKGKIIQKKPLQFQLVLSNIKINETGEIIDKLSLKKNIVYPGGFIEKDFELL